MSGVWTKLANIFSLCFFIFYLNEIVTKNNISRFRYIGFATERIVRQLNPQFIHCIGHSLGSHTCGFFGNSIREDKSYAKSSLDRLSAMDPAGPNFYDGKLLDFNAPLDEKLDKTDADLVDAIHSDSDIFGTIHSMMK